MKVLRNDFFFEEVEKIISQGESVEITIRGRSMIPYLRSEIDKVVLTPFNDSELKKGDIVLFHHFGHYLLHRIIKRKENRFIIQGDGIIIKKEEALPSDIIGIVSFIIRPNGKYVSVNSLRHGIYWRFWLFVKPFRRILLAVYNRLP